MVHLIWILILIISILIEAIIIIICTTMPDSSKVVEIVSLSGTVASTILAILAIVYSYQQNFSSKSSSETIANQLTQLQSTISNLTIQENKISNETTSLLDIVKQLENTMEIAQDTKLNTEQIFEKVTHLELPNTLSNEPTDNETQVQKLSEYILEFSPMFSWFIYKYNPGLYLMEALDSDGLWEVASKYVDAVYSKKDKAGRLRYIDSVTGYFALTLATKRDAISKKIITIEQIEEKAASFWENRTELDEHDLKLKKLFSTSTS